MAESPVYVVTSSLLLILVAGLAVLDAEQNAPGANITKFGDAIWWTFVTITTVGYGDFFPVTLLGRLVAAGLMISGIALLVTVTATFASWFIEMVQRELASCGPIRGRFRLIVSKLGPYSGTEEPI